MLFYIYLYGIKKYIIENYLLRTGTYKASILFKYNFKNIINIHFFTILIINYFFISNLLWYFYILN